MKEESSEERANVDENGKKIKVIMLEPTFLVLNQETLSLYKNENINSLMDSFPLHDIKCSILSANNYHDAIDAHFMTCFTIQIGLNENSKEVLCLESKMAVENWIDAINTFYQATIRKFTPDDHPADMKKGDITAITSSAAN